MKTLIIGRKDGCDIKISDKNNNISRKHATLIVYSDGTCIIKDEFSTNKTYVNNRPIDPGVDYPLKKGDKVLIARLFSLDWEKYARKYSSSRRTERKEKSFRRTAPLESSARIDSGRNQSSIDRSRSRNRNYKDSERERSNNNIKGSRQEKKYESESLGVTKDGTILQRTVASDFFDKLVPIPGLMNNMRLFSQLHFKPIEKILGLIQQPDDKAEAHPFSFLGFAVIGYAGFLTLASYILKRMVDRLGGTMEEIIKEDFSLEMLTNYPVMTAIYFALVTFIYSWVSYNIFKYSSAKFDTFRKFLKMISLSQGMFILHSGFWILAFLLFCNAIAVEKESYMLFFGIICLISFFACMYFFIVIIRVTRRFWEISWVKFIPLFLLVTIITSLFSYVANLALQMLAGAA